MKNTILKSILALGVIAFAASMLAVSCGKTAGGNNNNNSGNNSGNGGNNEPPLVPTTNLVLTNAGSAALIKLRDNTATLRTTIISGGGLSPLSSANDSDRGFDDAIAGGNTQRLFDIEYPGVKAAIVLVSRARVTKDTIAVKATTTTTYCSSSESGDNALASAADGGHCRWYSASGKTMYFDNYLGTVFDNANTTTHARGSLFVQMELTSADAMGNNIVIDDATAFNTYLARTYMVMINSGGGAATAVIDDTWLNNGASVKEVELYAIGIDVSDKTIEQISVLKKAEFDKGLDNAAFKKMLRNNKWGELKFKVKLVNAADFAATP